MFKNFVLFFSFIFTFSGLIEPAIIKNKLPEEDEYVSFRWPVIRVPLMSKEPQIDGKIEKEEWQGAAILSPMVNLSKGVITEEKTTIYIGYNKDKIFLAFQFERPPYALKPLAGKDPMAVWADDCLEFFLRPEFGSNWEYSFAGNALGIFEEGKRTNATDKRWKVDWFYNARITDWGWEGELAIPFTSLGKKTPEIGEVWEIAPTKNQKTPNFELACWSFLKDWFAHEDFGYLIFGGEIPAVRIISAGSISRKELGILTEVSNFFPKDRQIEVNYKLYQLKDKNLNYFKLLDEISNPLGAQAEVTPYLKAEEVVKDSLKNLILLKEERYNFLLPGNQTGRIPFLIDGNEGNYILYYCVKDKEKNIILSASSIPFIIKPPLDLSITPYILSSGVIEVTVNYRKVSNIGEKDIVNVILKDSKDEIINEDKRRVDLKNLQSNFDIPVKGLKQGNYKVKCVIEDEKQVKAEKEEIYILPEIPDWWNNKYGYPEILDIVPEPWTPMKKIKNGFKVWNREIELGKMLEPVQIKNNGIEMLTRPAVIDLKLSGKIEIKPVKCIKEKKTGITYLVDIKGERFKGKIILETEFDGFMKYTLTIEPLVEKESILEKLIFEIPLKSEITTHFHRGCIGTPPSYHESMKNSKDYGNLPSEGISLPFVHEIWLGNDEIGIEYVAESDQFWSLNDTKKAVEVIRKGDETVLRINVVDKPKLLKGPVIYQWAILPTPTKPMNKELQRNLFLVQSGFGTDETESKPAPDTEAFIDALVKAGANSFCQWAWKGVKQVWNEDFGAPGYRPTPQNEKRKKAFKEIIKMAHNKGIKWVIVYAIWNNFPDWPGLEKFWQEQSLYPLISNFGGYIYCPKKPFADWYIATLRKTIEELDIDGVYLDSSPDPRICTNLHHGCGYIDENGNLHGTYPVFATREFHKRIYFLFHGEVKKGGLIYAHNSHFPFMAVESFVDIHHCGEGSDLKLDYLIPKFYGYPFGLPFTFTRWNNPVYPETRMRSWRVVLQVDSTIKAHPSYVISKKDFPSIKGGREAFIKGYDDQSIVVWKIWQAQKEFSWDGAKWFPYWKVKDYLETGDEKLLPCLHLNPGKSALIVVSSFKNEPCNCNLKINWQKMGFDWKNVEIKDVITDEIIIPNQTGLNFQVLDNRWRMFFIKVK